MGWSVVDVVAFLNTLVAGRGTVLKEAVKVGGPFVCALVVAGVFGRFVWGPIDQEASIGQRLGAFLIVFLVLLVSLWIFTMTLVAIIPT